MVMSMCPNFGCPISSVMSLVSAPTTITMSNATNASAARMRTTRDHATRRARARSASSTRNSLLVYADDSAGRGIGADRHVDRIAILDNEFIGERLLARLQ